MKTPERVLFIGNSLTYYHDMPSLVSALCKAAGKTVTIASATYPAGNMCQQASTEHEVGKKVHELMKQPWDIVVLQPSRSINPRSPEVNEQMRLACLKLNEMARRAGAQPVLYCSWGNNTGKHNVHRMAQNGYDTEVIDSFPVTREEHNAYMQQICGEYAKMIDAPVVDCAVLMEKMIKALPEVPMILPDNRHPTQEASFGIACAFYDFFFREPSFALADTVEKNIDGKTAKILSKIADEWILQRGVTMATILDGKALATKIRGEIREQVRVMTEQGNRPGLAVILVGEDPASQVYVRNKRLACEDTGIFSEQFLLPADTTEQTLLDLIAELNKRKDIHGILLQAPIPAHLDYKKISETILPSKDVDAFHPYNVGKIMIGDFDFLPCTPAGVMELIHLSGVEVNGKNCVVIGRSNIVGKPMSMLLLHENGTVTICHSRTKNLKEITAQADILVSAVGKAHFVTADMVKPGAVVIDVGMNRDESGKLVGDVDYAEVEKVAGAITPVPGGVGPMTITMLLKNTLKAVELNK